MSTQPTATGKTLIGTIDMAPSWVDVMPVLLAKAAEYDPVARAELTRLAEFADAAHKALHKEVLPALGNLVLRDFRSVEGLVTNVDGLRHSDVMNAREAFQIAAERFRFQHPLSTPTGTDDVSKSANMKIAECARTAVVADSNVADVKG